jgi:hypothetical protein
MSRVKFRIASVLIGLTVVLGGAQAIRAQCNGGCNWGEYSGCYRISGCTGSDYCEQDICTITVCPPNHFAFCVSPNYMCVYPSCTYDTSCGCNY